MVYISDWQGFQEAAEELYAKSPNETRYCVKWKSSEGRLVLKITDNTTCIKFKTFSSIFLNRFEALNLSLMQKMQNQRPNESSAAPAADASQSEKPVEAARSISSATPTAGVVSGIKKKKPKKKK